VSLRSVVVLAWIASPVAAVGVAACRFDAPPIDDTHYSCKGGAACPTGFACIDEVCRKVGSDDADGALADAALPEPGDGGAPDAAPSGGARTVTFGEGSTADVRDVTADTWISDHFPNDVHGGDSELDLDGAPLTAALIRFDLRAIPSGATVESAVLTWVVFDPGTSAEVMSAQVLLMPWTEATATWYQATDGVAWPTEGALGDAVAAARIVDDVQPHAAGALALDLPASVVQAWVDAPATNFGLRWQATGTDLLRLRSREAADDQRPLLTVTYRPPP